MEGRGDDKKESAVKPKLNIINLNMFRIHFVNERIKFDLFILFP